MRITCLRLSIILLLSAACSTDRKKEDRQEKLVEANDSITLPGFVIDVVLSQKATRELANTGETIIVQAYLSGTPKDTTRRDVNEMGQLSLGSPKVEMKSAGKAKFTSVRISRDQFEALKDKNFEVLINVFSGRRSFESNVLEVEFLQEPLSVVQSTRHTLKGKLIGEKQ